MAMTNRQIIMTELALRGIMEEVDTYAGWQRRGMQVQRGKKALFVTQIWKPCKMKAKKETEESQPKQKLILVKAAFFGVSQVEPVKNNTEKVLTKCG